MTWDGGDESRVQALMAENERLQRELDNTEQDYNSVWGRLCARVAQVERLREALVAIETDYGVEDPQLTTYIQSVLEVVDA